MLEENKNNAGFWTKLIQGHYGLAKTYWLFGIAGGVVILILTSAIAFADGGIGMLLGVGLAALAYFVIWAIGVWRAATLYQGRRLWAILAKVAVILGVLQSVLYLGMMFLAA